MRVMGGLTPTWSRDVRHCTVGDKHLSLARDLNPT